MKNIEKWARNVLVISGIMLLVIICGIFTTCSTKKQEVKMTQTMQIAISKLNYDISNLQNELSYYRDVRSQCFLYYMNGEYTKPQKDSLIKSYNSEIYRFVESIKSNFRIINNIEHNKMMAQK